MDKINQAYLTDQAVNETASVFKETGHLTLSDFFTHHTYQEFSKIASRSAFQKNGIPNKYHFGSANIPKKLMDFLHHQEFLDYLSDILGIDVHQLTSGMLYQFKHKDYTLLHDDLTLEPGIDLVFEFTPEWNDQAGGEITYTKEGDAFSLPIKANSFSIINRTEEHRFVRYVNCHAKDQKRWFVLVTLEVQ